mmetsp:Transcript_31313/g.65527  ORF Transcript_31313/g.65527 Transcript_31313/m.65527 type:complete len:104 (+) Transcript_31313:384-695(+)
MVAIEVVIATVIEAEIVGNAATIVIGEVYQAEEGATDLLMEGEGMDPGEMGVEAAVAVLGMVIATGTASAGTEDRSRELQLQHRRRLRLRLRLRKGMVVSPLL